MGNFYLASSFIAIIILINVSRSVLATRPFEYFINTTWDSQRIMDHAPIQIILEAPNSTNTANTTNEPSYLTLYIIAKYFNSPNEPTDVKPGDFFNLWDYEGSNLMEFFQI